MLKAFNGIFLHLFLLMTQSTRQLPQAPCSKEGIEMPLTVN